MKSLRWVAVVLVLCAVVLGVIYWLNSGTDDDTKISAVPGSVDETTMGPRRSAESRPTSAANTPPSVGVPESGPTSMPVVDIGFLRGKVQSDDGQPISGAEVLALPVIAGAQRPATMNLENRFRAPTRIDRAVSAVDGTFELRLPAARQLRVEARAPGYSLAVFPVISTALDRPLSISLSRVDSVAGIVVDDVDQPVADAEVVIHEQFGPEVAQPYYGFRSFRTRVDGTFEFDLGDDVGVMIFTRRSPTSAGITHLSRIGSGHDRKLKLVLPRERRLTVSFDLSHGPPPTSAVEIEFVVTKPYWSLVRVCDPKEKIVIDHVPYGAIIGVAPRRGGTIPPALRKKPTGPFASFSPTPFEVPPDTDAEIVCPLIAGATLSGKTIDAITKQPIAGIKLRAGAMLGVDPVGLVGEAISGPDGQFVVMGFEEGRSTVVLLSREWCIEAEPSAPGAAPTDLAAAARARNSAAPVQMTVGQRRSFTIQTNLDAPLSDVVVPLVKTGRISGRVVDGDGQPLPFVRLEVKSGPADWIAGEPADAARFAEMATSPDGTFRLTGVFPGSGLVVAAKKPGYLDGLCAPLTLESGGEVRDVLITMLPQSKKKIVVLTSTAQPVAGLQISLTVPSDGGPFAGRSDNAVTNAAGEATFAKIPAALVDVTGFFGETPYAFKDQARSVRIDFRAEDRAVIEVVEVPAIRGRIVLSGGRSGGPLRIVAEDVATMNAPAKDQGSPFIGGSRPDRPSGAVNSEGNFVLRVEAGKSYRLYGVKLVTPTDDDRARGGRLVDRRVVIFTFPKLGAVSAGDLGECELRENGLRFDERGFSESDADVEILRRAFPECFRKDWP